MSQLSKLLLDAIASRDDTIQTIGWTADSRSTLATFIIPTPPTHTPETFSELHKEYRWHHRDDETSVTHDGIDIASRSAPPYCTRIYTSNCSLSAVKRVCPSRDFHKSNFIVRKFMPTRNSRESFTLREFCPSIDKLGKASSARGFPRNDDRWFIVIRHEKNTKIESRRLWESRVSLSFFLSVRHTCHSLSWWSY